jgi:hypothetical protein
MPSLGAVVNDFIASPLEPKAAAANVWKQYAQNLEGLGQDITAACVRLIKADKVKPRVLQASAKKGTWQQARTITFIMAMLRFCTGCSGLGQGCAVYTSPVCSLSWMP